MEQTVLESEDTEVGDFQRLANSQPAATTFFFGVSPLGPWSSMSFSSSPGSPDRGLPSALSGERPLCGGLAIEETGGFAYLQHRWPHTMGTHLKPGTWDSVTDKIAKAWGWNSGKMMLLDWLGLLGFLTVFSGISPKSMNSMRCNKSVVVLPNNNNPDGFFSPDPQISGMQWSGTKFPPGEIQKASQSNFPFVLMGIQGVPLNA